MQFAILIIALLIALGAFIAPELKTYALQLMALLMLFAIVIRHIENGKKRVESQAAKTKEDEVLFLATTIKPLLEELQNDSFTDLYKTKEMITALYSTIDRYLANQDSK